MGKEQAGKTRSQRSARARSRPWKIGLPQEGILKCSESAEEHDDPGAPRDVLFLIRILAICPLDCNLLVRLVDGEGVALKVMDHWL